MVAHAVDHHHGPPKDPYRVPKASEYQVMPAKLIQLQERLGKHGLKDPWVRNHIWKYDPRYGTAFTRSMKTFFRGLPLGFAAFLVTIGVETALGVDYHPWHHEHHGDGHGDKHGSDH